MGKVGNEVSGKVDLRTQMPKTAQTVARWRAEWGDNHVTETIRRGMRGEPGHFYAVEAGHVVGTPFDWADAGLLTVGQSIAAGASMVVVMRPPGQVA